MIVNRDQLEAMKMPELKQLALQEGLDASPFGERKETLIDRIMLKAAQEPINDKNPNEQHYDDDPKPQADEQEPQRPAADYDVNAVPIEEIRKACAGYILRGMKLFYNDDDKTWQMRVRLRDRVVRDSRDGTTKIYENWKEDSGTCRQPLEVIKRQARILMQGVPTKDEVQVKPITPSGMEEVA